MTAPHECNGNRTCRTDDEADDQLDRFCEWVGEDALLQVLPSAKFRRVTGPDRIKRLAQSYDERGERGTYFCTNPLKPGEKNRNDNAIESRRFLFIDCDDPDHDLRVKFIEDGKEVERQVPATDAGKAVARKTMDKIVVYLANRGWSAPVQTDSGNGYAAFYHVDLPNNEPTTNLIRAFLGALLEEFGPCVDIANSDASRLARVPGTMNRRGRETPDRPFRMCKFVDIPELAVELVTADMIQGVIEDLAAVPSEAQTTNGSAETWTAVPGDDRPGDEFNRTATWASILEPAGFKIERELKDGVVRWTRPGKEVSDGCSATTDWCKGKDGTGRFFLWSSKSGTGIPVDKALTKFAVYAYLNHCGDFRSAAKALAAQRSPASMKNGTAMRPTPSAQMAAAGPTEAQARPIRKYEMCDLIDRYPKLNDPLIDGILRRRETANIVSVSKIGKSWLVYGLALTIATGRRWLGQFETTRGRVLLVDNELHDNTIASRLKSVALAMGMGPEECRNSIEIWTLRGDLRNIHSLRAELNAAKGFALVILDAKYRLLPSGTSENDNDAEKEYYNILDSIAEANGAAILNVHHSTKGSQAEKRVTDVGAGGGAQSRAADAHIILREHDENDACVLDAAVRTFAKPEPLALRWAFPLWIPADDLDTSKLKGRSATSDARQRERDAEGIGKLLDRLLKGPALMRDLRACGAGGHDRVYRYLSQLESENRVEWTSVRERGNETREYRLKK